MKRTAISLALLIALLKFTGAQPALGIDSIAITPDTVALGQSVNILLNVVNTGDSAFFGPIVLHFAVNNFFGVLDTSNGGILLDSGQSIQVTVSNYFIDQPIYAVGDNIVVIWPAAFDGNVVTTDSIHAIIHVLDSLLSSGSPPLKDQIKVFYKTSDKSLFIDYGDLIGKIDDVTCYSILGQRMAVYNYAVNEISFGENSPQIFLLAIRTKEGEIITFKILRM